MVDSERVGSDWQKQKQKKRINGWIRTDTERVQVTGIRDPNNSRKWMKEWMGGKTKGLARRKKETKEWWAADEPYEDTRQRETKQQADEG